MGGGADSWGRASSLAASLAAVPSRQSDRIAKAARKLCEAVPSKITYAFFRMLLPSAGERWARLSADFAACFTDVGSAAESLSCFTMAAPLARARAGRSGIRRAHGMDRAHLQSAPDSIFHGRLGSLWGPAFAARGQSSGAM